MRNLLETASLLAALYGTWLGLSQTDTLSKDIRF